MATFKENSRIAFTEDKPSHDGIRTGAMPRIADACEIIAKDKQDLLATIERLKQNNEYYRQRNAELSRQNLSLTRLKSRYKNQLDKLKQEKS